MADNPTDDPNNDPDSDSNGDPQQDHTDIPLRYAGQSQMVAEESTSRLALFGNLARDPVFLDGKIKDPLRLREALGALYDIVGSDYRYAPKDRTKYNAYRRMRRESANLNAWQAQRAYFDWLFRNDPLAFCILDPVISVHPDQVFFEVFSKDEGTYGHLAIDMDAFELEGTPAYGTTNIDFSKDLHDSIQRFRGYRETRITIGQEAVKVATEGEKEVLEKQIRIPDSWLRGFLQVQSSTMLPTDTFRLAPIDLYNVLRHLRMNGDVKGKRRGLRVELVPGERPRLVLEPWETVLESQSSVDKYEGKQAKVLRLWGRRRLMLLKRMLPFVESVEVHVMGSGLPSFWVLRAGQITFTMGLTGFTASNWSQSINFDLMLPRQTQDSKPLEKIVKLLASEWSAERPELTKATKLDGADLIEPLQLGCQHGQLMYDLPKERFRLRPLTGEPLSLDRLEFRNARERLAFDLVNRKGGVSITKENRIFGSGIEITGKADVKEDSREYRPQMLLSDEGFVSRSECTCTTFRQQGLKGGPCTHLIALRLSYAMRERKRRESGEAEKTVTVETRSFSRRQKQHETIYQLSLDQELLKIRWGDAGQNLRVQQLQFASVDEARDEYFGRIDRLKEKGYLDAE